MSLETKTHNISCFPPKNHDGNFVPIEIEFFKANCSQLKLPCPRDSVVGLAIDSNELKLRTKRRQFGHDTPLGKIQVARLLHIFLLLKKFPLRRGGNAASNAQQTFRSEQSTKIRFFDRTICRGYNFSIGQSAEDTIFWIRQSAAEDVSAPQF